MKLTALFFGICVGTCPSIFASNTFPISAGTTTKHAPPSQHASFPGYCEIEIVNNSFDDIRVYGVFDDGALLEPINIYSFEAPYHIPLYYYGYCHAGMNLYIDTFTGYHVYAGYTERRSSIHVPYYTNPLKVEVSK